MHAELCPVCKGSGKYHNKECHGCNGKGWILVPEVRTEPWYPYYPTYPTSPYPIWYRQTYGTGTGDKLPEETYKITC